MLKRFIWIYFYLAFTSLAHASISVVDDKSRTIQLEKPATRIISLAPHITESLFEAGAGGHIIGTVAYSDYPEDAKKIPRVSGYPTLDIERIISLKPDLIIAWSSGNNTQQVNKLISLGLNVFFSEPRHIKDIADSIKRFGVIAGTTKVSEQAYDDFLQHYESLRTHFSSKEKINVFYQIWNKPLITINGKHLISDVIELCGGKNVFSDLHSLTPKVSLESVIATNTDVILLGAEEKKKSTWVNEWQLWLKYSAMKKEQIHSINPDLLNRVGPRVLSGAEKLCKILDQVRKSHSP